MRPPVAGVELDARDEDLPQVETIGEDPGRHEAAARDCQHEVVVAADRNGEPPHERVKLVPADRDRIGARWLELGGNQRAVHDHGSAAIAAAASAALPDWTTRTESLRTTTYETDVSPP